MPHQCVRCSTMYDDGSKEILTGCACGCKLFFFIKKERLEQAEKLRKEIHLSTDDKKQIEEDIYDLVGSKLDKDIPVILDIETINVLKPGKYELDLVHLFKGDPLIFKLEEGKYVIDLAESFRTLMKSKK